MNRKKVLLGHLNSMGDCLFAGVIARQIKEVDFPDCHLTWAINVKSKPVIELNPYVDEIWEIPTEKSAATLEEWKKFTDAAAERKRNGDFDEVFLTQINGDNNLNYDGGIRSSTYNNYPHGITVSHQPTIRLSNSEIENVKRFAAQNKLAAYKKVVLVECGPESFAASLNPQSAYELARKMTAESENVAFILSSNKKIDSEQANIIDGSKLSFRENAELTKYCDLFVGCASGISWLTTTDWAKKLPMVLMINRQNTVFPSMIYDHRNIGLAVDHLIEIGDDTENALEKLRNCLQTIFDGRFEEARTLFNEEPVSDNFYVLRYQLEIALSKKNPKVFFSSIFRYIKRNGVRKLIIAEIVQTLRGYILRTGGNLLRFLRLKKKLPSKIL